MTQKKGLAKTPFGLFKNSIVLSLCEDLKLAATWMP